MNTLSLPILAVSLFLTLRKSAVQALPIFSNTCAPLLVRRQDIPAVVPTSNQPLTPAVFITVGSIVVIGIMISMIGVVLNWRRKSHLARNNLANGGYDSNGNPIAGSGGGDNSRGPMSDKGQPILAQDELDKLFPAISFAEFVESSGKVSEITSSMVSLHNVKTACANDEKYASIKDATTVVLEPTASELSKAPTNHHIFHRGSDNYICAICQQNIGDEEPESTRASVNDIDISLPADQAVPNTSQSGDNDLAVDLEKTAATSTDTQVASTNNTVSRPIFIRQLPCNHIFHDGCIVPWLTLRKACCPLCQFNLRENINLLNSTENESGHDDSNTSVSTSSSTDIEVSDASQIARPEPARVRSTTAELQPAHNIIV